MRYDGGMSEKKTYSRRDFLKIAGVAAGGAALGWAALGREDGQPNIDEATSLNTIEVSTDERVIEDFRNFGYDEGSVREMMEQRGMSEETYGILAASGVSIAHEQRDSGELTFGSGSVVTVAGRYFLATTLHVIEEDRQIGEVHFQIPGLEDVYKMTPDTMYSYVPRIQDVPDAAVLLPLDDVAEDIGVAMDQGVLSPLEPRPLVISSENNALSVAPNEFVFFRFQGGRSELYDMSVFGFAPSDSGIDHLRSHTNGHAVVGPGISGSPVLVYDNVNGWGFAGVYDRVTNEGISDELGVLGDVMSDVADFVPLDASSVSRGLYEVDVGR